MNSKLVILISSISITFFSNFVSAAPVRCAESLTPRWVSDEAIYHFISMSSQVPVGERNYNIRAFYKAHEDTLSLYGIIQLIKAVRPAGKSPTDRQFTIHLSQEYTVLDILSATLKKKYADLSREAIITLLELSPNEEIKSRLLKDFPIPAK